jgi:hypothetical protein
MDDCADIVGCKPVLRQVNSQCHTVEFSNHTGKG